MSTTPRTDAVLAKIFDLSGQIGPANAPESLVSFARKLERELAAKEQELAEARKELTTEKQRADLEEAAAALYAKTIFALRQQLAARDATIEGLRDALTKTRTQLMAHGAAENCISCALAVVDAALAQLPPLPSAVRGHPDTARLDKLEIGVLSASKSGIGWRLVIEGQKGSTLRQVLDDMPENFLATRQSTGEQGT